MAAANTETKPRVLVMWGGTGEDCQTLAESYAVRFRANGWSCDTLSLTRTPKDDLANEPLILVVAADEYLPDNSAALVEQFFSEAQSRLESTRYSVLSLGDLGNRMATRLQELGAIHLHENGKSVDEADQWFDALVPKIYDTTIDTYAREVIPFGKKNPFPAPLFYNQHLNKAGAFKDTRHLEFSLQGSGLSYEAGDVVATYPQNCPDLVDATIAELPFEPGNPITLKDGTTLPFREALLEQFDIRTITKSILKKWGAKTDNTEFHAILEDDKATTELIDGIEIIDLLKNYPANFTDAQDFISILRKLNPRLYSIASSPNAHTDEVHLTVAKVEYETKGRHRKGVASTFLCDRVKEGATVRVFMQVSKHFRLPSDPATDVIMVGPGTGIAPFRAFLEERAAIQATGRNWLFFGNPHEATDFYYQDELLAYQNGGLLNRLDLAWSRDQEQKIYVQDKMRDAKAELWQWLDAGAHFYVCGDASRMAGDVDQALREAIQEGAGISEAETDAYIEQMKTDHRYQRDVY